MRIWFGVRKSTRTRVTMTTWSLASARPSTAPAQSGEFVCNRKLTSVKYCAGATLIRVCVCVCVSGMLVVSLQQLLLLATSTRTRQSFSVSWTQRSIWKHSQENYNYWPTRCSPLPQVGSTPHYLQHFALMFSLDILAYLTPHMYRCNAQWLTDFRHCYHENFVFTAMALLFNSGNASKHLLSAYIDNKRFLRQSKQLFEGEVFKKMLLSGKMLDHF